MLARRAAPLSMRSMASRRTRPRSLDQMDTQRLILLFIFSFSLLMLWEAWEKESRPKPAASAPAAQQKGVPAPAAPAAGVPAAGAPAATPAKPASSVPTTDTAAKGEVVRVTTDLFIAEIDSLGATLRRLELLRHKDSADPTKGYVLLGSPHQYEAQSGLTGEAGPNPRTLWQAEPGERALASGKDAVEVRF